MQRGSLILLVSIALLFSCTKKKQEIILPIEEEKLINALVDIHFAESFVNNIQPPKKDSLLNIYYHQIYHIHQIDSADFIKSMTILRQHPAKLEKIYIKVQEKFKVLEVQYKGPLKEDPTSIGGEK